MKHKTSELEGGWLAYAVAKADCKPLRLYGGEGAPLMLEWDPVTRWADGGPIIEREKIALANLEHQWRAWLNYDFPPGTWVFEQTSNGADGSGPTPLIAAMRAFVKSKLGEEVDLP